MQPSNQLLQALAVTAECCGTELSEAAGKMMATDLAQFPEEAVLKALVKVRREHQGRLTLAAIVSRIDDGRPGPEEAWAAVPKDEYSTAVLTREMARALAAATPLMADDPIAARMAFREAYKRECEEARATMTPIEWQVSAGWDAFGRVDALADAVKTGKISAQIALQYCSDDCREAMQVALGHQPEAIAGNVRGVLASIIKRPT